MKIGFFTDTYFPQINGVTYTINLWKRWLEKLGHEVFIYYPENSGYRPQRNEVPLKSIPFLFYKGYEIGLPSFKVIEKDLDIVHLQSPGPVGLLGMAAARKWGIPCIVTYHTPPDHYIREIIPTDSEIVQRILKAGYYKYEGEMLERCQLVTSPSEEVVRLLKERHGDIISKAIFFSNGLDLDFFKEADCRKFKRDYGIPKGKVIGFAGRHSTEKHVEDLIVFADHFDGTVLIGGEGPLTKDYKGMAAGKKNVIFIGFLPRERLCEFYSCIDLLILPSTAETEGLVVLEANACGTPAVGADAMALKNTIQEGVNGYRYRPGDIDDLGKKVQIAYKNMKKLKSGSKRFAKGRSVEKTVKKLAEVYKMVKEEGVPK